MRTHGMFGSTRGSLFLLAALVGLAATTPVDADQEFTNESIQGKWGFSAAGSIVPPAVPTAVPAVALGIMVFNRDGTCSIADTININGSSFSRASLACSFSVNADGTGTITAEFPGDPGPTPLAFVIVDHKSAIRFIRTDVGVASGSAKPM